MNWNVSGSTVSINGKKFAINARWFVEFDISGKFKAATASTLKMLVEDVSYGIVVDRDGKRQIAKMDETTVGSPVLSACFIGKQKNCCVFAKVGADKYWAVSINAGGFVTGSLENDKVHSLELMKKFIHQEMIMSDDQSTYRIVNVGEDTDLRSVELSSSLSHMPVDIKDISDEDLDNATVGHQIGFRRTQIAIAVGGVAAAIVGASYYFFCITPPEISDIMSGVYSDGFTQHYNSLKSDEEKIFNKNNHPETNIDIENTALDEFNEYLLLRDKGNGDRVKTTMDIHRRLPRRMDGWSLAFIRTDANNASVSFNRLYSYPVSSTYKTLDNDLHGYMLDRGFVIRPMRLLNKGKTRIYAISRNGEVTGATHQYTQYLANKRKNINDREKLVLKIKNKQAQVDIIKSEIEDSEQSMGLLSASDAHNSDVVELVLKSIKSKIDKSEPQMLAIKADLGKLSAYKAIQPPANNKFLLSSSDADVGFINTLQSINNITWTEPALASTFPVSQGGKKTDRNLDNFVGIKGFVFSVDLNSKSEPLKTIDKLLGDDRLFIVGTEVTPNGNKLPKIKILFEYFVKS